jgi:hypothetical protein
MYCGLASIHWVSDAEFLLFKQSSWLCLVGDVGFIYGDSPGFVFHRRRIMPVWDFMRRGRSPEPKPAKEQLSEPPYFFVLKVGGFEIRMTKRLFNRWHQLCL